MGYRPLRIALLLISSLILEGGCKKTTPAENEPPRPAAAMPASAPTSLQQQRENAERQVRPDIERERKQAQDQASKSLDQDAISAIQDTSKAIDDIAANKTKDALADIEMATGKINILLARNPSSALIPVAAEVDLIDTAPHDEATLNQFIGASIKAVDAKDFPTGRLLLRMLMSEIRITTSNLPLASYPNALKDAARSLDQGKTSDASSTLLTALNTLVIVEQVIPLPVIVARTAINDAEGKSKTDKAGAQTLLELARNELNRGKELGYSFHVPAYASLDSEISNLEKQVKAGSNTTSLFARLRNELTDILHRHRQ